MRLEKRIRRLVEQATDPSLSGSDPLVRALNAEVPAARRVAAIGLGRVKEGVHLRLLQQRLGVERCATVRMSLGLALVQCGADVDGTQRICAQPLRLRTTEGFREIPQDLPLDLHQTRLSTPETLRELVENSPDQAGEALLALAVYQHPTDLHAVDKVSRAGGRRTEHLCLEALGLLGQPGSLPSLVATLGEFHVDPGRGFARRRIAATALGRLGIPGAWRPLVRAFALEAAEHEGRPGAGMGIQYPVRSAILWALGELQVQRTAPLLCEQLAEMSSSPLGGLHLPAMEALWKLGKLAKPTLELAVRNSDALIAVHAACVLEAMGYPESLHRLAAGGGDTAEQAGRTLAFQ